MSEGAGRSALELWGGFECTVNRVGDTYLDQLAFSGHDARADDLDRAARLGIKAVRYPVLWERVRPDADGAPDWAWADERLGRLRELGVRPVVGLVHHGSGPRHTSLVSPGFAEGLARYARAVAERFPWVEDYTPVNEPLTTARFSGLYGHWYPHGRDDRTFVRALLTECRATALAMRAARAVNPAARLVQTEDVGRTHSTPRLAYQARFENERRWLTFDLLCGRVNRQHPLREYLCRSGATETELAWFEENPCPPDLLGVNYYATSERFLDERLERYPACSHGGNGRDDYADVEAVRVRAEGLAGLAALLREAWQRYGIPLAVTEVHLGCWREEQLRWFLEAWDAAQAARSEGADVRAVTAWSLLGAFDWDSLVTRCRGHYEPGVFDLRAPEPRPTALAVLVSDLAAGRRPDHPALDTAGWWRRADRVRYPAVATANTPAPGHFAARQRPRPLLIIGRDGTLGRAFGRICGERGLAHRLVGRREVDIAEPASVESVLAATRPWAVVNAAGYVRVDDAESEPERCWRENTLGPTVLAEACARRRVPLLTFSSDLVFDGQVREPYGEGAAVAPLNVYGRTKAEAERHVLGLLPAALVVRTSAFFGPWDEHNFLAVALRTLRAGRPFRAAADLHVSPTYVPDLVHACLDLLVDGASGLWHLANAGVTTWAGLARRAADAAGFDLGLVLPCEARSFNLPACRPAFSALTSQRGAVMPPLEDAVARFVRQQEHRESCTGRA